MLLAVIERVSARLLASHPPDHAYTLHALGDAGLPDTIVHFVAQTLQRRLESEVQTLADARTRWFDYAHAEMQAAQDTYFETLSQHAQVPAEEWARTLRQAVEQVVPYLVQPARTLGAFVFPEGRDALPAAVVLRRMRYFNAYPYLTDVVVAYIQRKEMSEIDRAVFVPLLHRIEHRTPDEYTPEGWRALLAPLFEVVGEGEPTRVPAPLLARFFQDKGMSEVAHQLEEQNKALSQQDLQVLLTPRPVVSQPAPPPAPVASPAVADPVEMDQFVNAAPPRQHVAAPVRPAPEQAASTAGVPLWQRYQHGTPPAPPPVKAGQVAPPPAGMQAPASARAGAPLWQRFRREGDVPEPGTEPDQLDRLEARVLGGAGSRQRRVFVRTLFSGSEPAYRALLERLQTASSWPEASRLIAESFRQHQVNIYQDAAIAFTDAAEGRFTSG